MHGPYTVTLTDRRTREVVVELSPEDLSAAESARRTADRFYRDTTSGLAEGALRIGVFAAAELLQPGEELGVQVIGFTGSGRTETPTEWKGASARRDEDGRFITSLGSRFNERVFVGV